MNTAFHKRFIHELQDIYDAEYQIVEALPAMIEAASNAELKAAFEEHLDQTENQIKRLEQVFDVLEEKPKRTSCDGMKGLLKEGEKILAEDLPADVCDAALIAAAQKVEHYEIAAYGTVASWAEMMEHHEAAELLGETLDEERETDEKLTELAEGVVNIEAEMEEDMIAAA